MLSLCFHISLGRGGGPGGTRLLRDSTEKMNFSGAETSTDRGQNAWGHADVGKSAQAGCRRSAGVPSFSPVMRGNGVQPSVHRGF